MTGAVILILAAGASSRMRGRDKLLEPVAQEPLLARQIRIAQATGAQVLVAVPPGTGLRQSLVQQAGATAVPVADCATGMAASIRAGVAAVPSGATGLLLMLADMPEIETPDLIRLLHAHAATPDVILRACGPGNEPGHPILFPEQYFAALSQITGDRGGRDIVAAGPVHLIPLPGRRALTDLDTPEEWDDWHRHRAP
jgi:molybdenum cofactor cytidylyltransferase